MIISAILFIENIGECHCNIHYNAKKGAFVNVEIIYARTTHGREFKSSELSLMGIDIPMQMMYAFDREPIHPDVTYLADSRHVFEVLTEMYNTSKIRIRNVPILQETL